MTRNIVYDEFAKEFIAPNSNNVVNENIPVSNCDPAIADRELFVTNLSEGIKFR